MNVAKNWVIDDMDDDIVAVAERAARDAGLSLEDWLARAIVDAYRKEIVEGPPAEPRSSPGPLFDAAASVASEVSEDTARLIQNLDREAEDSYVAAPSAERLAPLVDEVSRHEIVDPHAMPPPSPAIRFGRFAMGLLILLVVGTIVWAVATSQFGRETKIEEAAVTRPIVPPPSAIEEPAVAEIPAPAEAIADAPVVPVQSAPTEDNVAEDQATESIEDVVATVAGEIAEEPAAPVEEEMLPLETERVAVLPINTPPPPTGAEEPAAPLRRPIVKPEIAPIAATAETETATQDTPAAAEETAPEGPIDTPEPAPLDAVAEPSEPTREAPTETPGGDIAETVPQPTAAEDPGESAANADTESGAAPAADPASVTPSAAAPSSAPSSLDGFVAAAQAGDPDAQHDLALIYVQGRGVDQDYESAAYWFREAALQGNANAQYNLGVMYEQGLGVPKDQIEALLLYLSAAEQGHVAAQYNAGLAYAEGKNIPRNFAEARRWFSAAADQGLPEAQYNLGIIYENGLGVPRDEITAFRYYGLATAAGHPEAERKLDRLSQRLTPAERETATRLVRESLPPQSGGGDTLASAELSRAEIREVQDLLTSLGFDAGPADGVAGSRTVEAIRQYQQGTGLVVDGRPTSSLLDHLRQNAGV